jgi:hypothetical protein
MFAAQPLRWQGGDRPGEIAHHARRHGGGSRAETNRRQQTVLIALTEDGE